MSLFHASVKFLEIADALRWPSDLRRYIFLGVILVPHHPAYPALHRAAWRRYDDRLHRTAHAPQQQRFEKARTFYPLLEQLENASAS